MGRDGGCRALEAGVGARYFLGSRDDAFSHYSESVQLARAVPGVELKLLQDGGPLMMFNEAGRIADQIREFVRARSLGGGADSMRADALAGSS